VWCMTIEDSEVPEDEYGKLVEDNGMAMEGP
jgi:hypothetical protein